MGLPTSITPLLSTSTIIMKTACLLLVVFVAVACAQDFDFTTPSDADMAAACAAGLKAGADYSDAEFTEADLAEYVPADALNDATVQAVVADIKAKNYAAACTKLYAAAAAAADAVTGSK